MKRIKIITALLILAIVISASSAIVVINGKDVDPIKKVTIAENSTSEVSIKWQSIKGVDGYKVYRQGVDNDEYELAEKLIDPEISEYRFSGMAPASVFKVKVSAYKIFNKKEYEGEASQPIEIYTNPEKEALKAYSGDEGVLTLNWNEQSNINGYEIEYSKDKDFSEKESSTVSSDASNKLEIKELTPKETYYSRIRSYITVGEENIYGEWSDTQKAEIKEKYVVGADIDPNKPMVALSFDDGPGYPYDGNDNPTMQILDILEKYGARATFFMCGSRINSLNEECLKREIELGCEIGSHTYDHSNYGKKVTAKDISKNTEVIKKACGQAPTIFRCPGGMMSSTIQEECKKEGMPIAYWSVDTEDWKSRNPKSICSIAQKQVYDGAIILMHDIYPTTAQALKKIVPQLIKDGYQIVTVTEMLTVKNGGKAPQAGQQYIDYKTINNNT